MVYIVNQAQEWFLFSPQCNKSYGFIVPVFRAVKRYLKLVFQPGCSNFLLILVRREKQANCVKF